MSGARVRLKSDTKKVRNRPVPSQSTRETTGQARAFQGCPCLIAAGQLVTRTGWLSGTDNAGIVKLSMPSETAISVPNIGSTERKPSPLADQPIQAFLFGFGLWRMLGQVRLPKAALDVQLEEYLWSQRKIPHHEMSFAFVQSCMKSR